MHQHERSAPCLSSFILAHACSACVQYGKVDQDLGAPLDGPYQYINMLEAQIRGSAPYREVNADLLGESMRPLGQDTEQSQIRLE